MGYLISKYYRNTLGLDLRVSDLLRDTGAATAARNLKYRQTGALSKRQGQQIRTEKGTGGAGLVKYSNIEIGTGIITEELLSVDDNLHKLIDQNFTITYTGPDSALYDLYLDKDTGTFKFDLYESGDIVFSQDLGTGKGVSDTTVAQIQTLVNAEANFSMTISDVGTLQMALAPISRSVAITSSGTSTTYNTWSNVPTPSAYSSPFDDHWAIKGNEDFEIASFAQVLDVLYIANGYDELHKYDGSRVYRAGLPKPADINQTAGAGGSLSSGDYQWKYTYETTDAKQNIIVGEESELSEYTAVGSDSRTVELAMLAADSGFNTTRAVVNGTQSLVTTITVDSTSEMLVGDQVYIKDSVSGEVQKREVTALTSTTFTVSGSNISVNDNDVISTIKISLWRTRAGGSVFFLVGEYTHDWSVAVVAVDDGTADSALAIEYIPPIKRPGLPPSCRYIDVWRNQLVMTGNREDVNTVYYSDFDVESFPLDQSFVTEARLGGGNTGIKSQDNTLFIFKPRSIITCTGDLGTDQFQVDALADDGVGCVSNASIQEVNGVVWFLGQKGVYQVNRSGYQEMSDKIEPRFDGTYDPKRATSFYWIDEDLYVLQLPEFLEDGSGNKYLDNNNSIVLVYDIYRNAWIEWDSLNFSGGIAEYNSQVYTAGFEEDPVTLLATQYTKKFSDTGTGDDYADHELGISFTFSTHWEAAGMPSVYKKFLRLKVHALDGTIRDFETDTFSIDVTTEHDYSPVTEASLSLDFSGGAEGWGTSTWGDFIWGESRLEQLTSKLSSKKAKALRLTMSNNRIQENVLVSGYELEISSPYDTQIKE